MSIIHFILLQCISTWFAILSSTTSVWVLTGHIWSRVRTFQDLYRVINSLKNRLLTKFRLSWLQDLSFSCTYLITAIWTNMSLKENMLKPIDNFIILTTSYNIFFHKMQYIDLRLFQSAFCYILLSQQQFFKKIKSKYGGKTWELGFL